MTEELQQALIQQKEKQLQDAQDLVEQIEDEIENLWQEDIEEPEID